LSNTSPVSSVSTKSGHININYYPHVVETLDTGDVLDKSKADGVLLSIIFEFEKPIKL